MQVSSRISRAISGVFSLSFVCFLSACSVFGEAPPEDPIVLEPVVEETPEPEIPLIPAPVDPTPDPIVPEPLPEPPTVAIALSSRQPAYEAVARELSNLLEEYAIYDLSDRSQPPVTAFRLINDSDAGVVVAIGLRAARSSIGAPPISEHALKEHAKDRLKMPEKTRENRGNAGIQDLYRK